jgi:predicted DNA-binding transcriptional regulator AlpA
MEAMMKELQELKKLTLLGAKQTLTMNDTVLLTGLSKSHLYKLCCERQIPYYKGQGGKLTYFDKTEIENWCKQHRVTTTDEVEARAINYVVTGKMRKEVL